MRINFLGQSLVKLRNFIELNFNLLDAFVKQVLKDVSAVVIATFVLVMLVVALVFTF
jgi:hypothetical protein